MTFTSTIESHKTVFEGSHVTFTCERTGTSDVELWLHDKTNGLDFNGKHNNSLELSWQLSRVDNGREFVCRGTGTEADFYIESANTFWYNVECK